MIWIPSSNQPPISRYRVKCPRKTKTNRHQPTQCELETPRSWATAHFIQLNGETDNMLNFWNVAALQFFYKDFTNWHENQSGSLALIYQSCVEMCAYLHTGLLVWKDARVIPEISIYGWPQCMTQRILINAAAENDQHYVPPLNIQVSEALSAETSLRGVTEETKLF